MELGEAIEKILISSNLSISAFSKKVGYSRQYIYELLKSKDSTFKHKIQLDTLKKICDSTNYSLELLLMDIGYIPRKENEFEPNTVVIIRSGGVKTNYNLVEKNIQLIEQLANALKKDADR